MGIEEREVPIEHVAIGMFVCRLDRPWTETPFPLQGFRLDSLEQVGILREHCSRVWIDVHRSRAAPEGLPRQQARPLPAPSALPLADPVLHRRVYADSTKLDQELPAARGALEDAAGLTARVMDDLRAGHVLDRAAVRAAAEPVVASMLRNADALLWVNALRERSGYAYTHAINCSALAAAFGRHLGMPEEVLVDLACGALLLDIGKIRVPDEVIMHPGPLNALSMARARRHVELGLQIIEEAGDPNPVVLGMLADHHERVDGSGYPARKREAAIPLYARMAAIIDSFDAMTSERPHAPARPRHDALQELYRGRGSLYHAELVEQFIGCLGVYPTGSLVELETGEVAAVMAQNPSRRLRPRIMLLTGADKRLRDDFRIVDLMDDASTPRLAIRRALATGEHGIDLAELYL